MKKDIFKPLTKEELLNKKKRLKEDEPIKETKNKKRYNKKFITCIY